MRRIFLYISFILIAASCREVYDPPYTGPSAGYLVVEGVINSNQGPTTFRLSRTVALPDSSAMQNEQFANVKVEGEDNSSYVLNEMGGGVYRADQLPLNPAVKYRLHIITFDGREYLSDYTENRQSPPIDQITWERTPDGVQLFIDTHDPDNSSHYYKWDYEETWEFKSAYSSAIKYLFGPDGKVYDIDFNTSDEASALYTCWRSEASSNILIGSSVRLSRDTIHLPIAFVPQNSWKMSVLYSINVSQYSPSLEGYQFLERMKKNTEQLGSLFDAQPSQLGGNIHSVTNPSEYVIGFVDVAKVQAKRIFISRSQVSPWNFQQGCEELSLKNNPDSLNAVAYAYLPTQVHQYNMFGGIDRIWASTHICVDCTLRGTNVKPSYWP